MSRFVKESDTLLKVTSSNSALERSKALMLATLIISTLVLLDLFQMLKTLLEAWGVNFTPLAVDWCNVCSAPSSWNNRRLSIRLCRFFVLWLTKGAHQRPGELGSSVSKIANHSLSTLSYYKRNARCSN